jgi:ubiquinone/menaquinone biosynthesis C-methylase UbiE
MPPDAIVSSHAPIKTTATTNSNKYSAREHGHDSLFEHVAWVYAFCREHLFRDDTERIIARLWPGGQPAPGTTLIELGCGPGFYSCRLAARFRDIAVTGVDRSESQLQRARERADTLGLTNCSFKRINALQLSCADGDFNILIASRLFTVLPEPDRAIAQMFRVLKPGGLCFIAEPRHAFRASIPLLAMWLLAGVTRFKNGYCEPRKAAVFSASAFENLFPTQPWKRIETWQEGRYQYALCEKG